MHFLKWGQQIRARVAPPPSFGQCPKENVFFSIDVVTNVDDTRTSECSLTCPKINFSVFCHYLGGPFTYPVCKNEQNDQHIRTILPDARKIRLDCQMLVQA